jgi:transcriptional regulator with XRE-family HTH domain
MNIAQLVTNAKESANIPIRKLAADAGVAGSTITRIQAGTVDPSFDTLTRILEATGYDLEIVATPHGARKHPRLADLIDAWSFGDSTIRLAWTRWRTFLDRLALHPENLPEAIYTPPPPSGNNVVDNLLAAVAEQLADDANLPRPSWTNNITKLTAPYRPATARNLPDTAIPEQFAARGLMIDTASLWRPRGTVGV